MSTVRKMIRYSSENGRTEINYSTMPDTEIDSRIAAYEKKYGKTLKSCARTFSCDHANHQEIFDIEDWETLAEERKSRHPKLLVRSRKPAYQH